jgi:peptidyl-prolyl cis-trans isomerase C
MSLTAALTLPPSAPDTDAAAAHRYHLLRAATERFKCNVPALDAEQRAEAEALSAKTLALENLVLGAPEAAKVQIPDAAVEQSFRQIAGRFDSPAELNADLARNGLDAAALKLALRRELTFDAVMHRVGARHAAVTDTDERLFYELHHDRFSTPERRAARHILVTVNDDYAENSREAAQAKVSTLVATLRDGAAENLAQRFAKLARRHSECPTAMQDGKLGDIVRGQLYPEVDAALFALPAGGLSDPVCSEIGFHILLCERIDAARPLPFAQVRERIRTALTQRRQREAQRAWLDALRERQAMA